MQMKVRLDTGEQIPCRDCAFYHPVQTGRRLSSRMMDEGHVFNFAGMRKVKSLEFQIASLKKSCENLREQAKASKRELEALTTEKHNLESCLEKSQSEKRLTQQKLSVYELERAALKAVAMTTTFADGTNDDEEFCDPSAAPPSADGRPRHPKLRQSPVKLYRPGSDASRLPRSSDPPPPSGFT
ncbi:unnamed protein product [Schistocephalus solidus]|uniref:Uncharacterized protein n=1 Tax=Schistocephalus solidus TaxID=70667 RepID=A0A183T9C6_SCHSO|nr:unnamed protein product [Schistocephalus solidus]